MMDYCTKWKLVGLAIGLSPLFLALVAGTWAARQPRQYWLALISTGIVSTVILVATHPLSLILWNGLRPAICDRIN